MPSLSTRCSMPCMKFKQPGDLQKDKGHILEHFSEPTLEGILRSLTKAEDKGCEWARKTLADLAKCSPLSLAITIRHIQSALSFDIRQTLIEDYRLAVRCIENHDFHEGVRALLIDKDGNPAWKLKRYDDSMATVVG